jgi:hypothetical protein
MVEASPSLVEILRSTLARVEQSADLSPDDPAVVKLRNLVLRLIAELEVAKTRKTAWSSTVPKVAKGYFSKGSDFCRIRSISCSASARSLADL